MPARTTISPTAIHRRASGAERRGPGRFRLALAAIAAAAALVGGLALATSGDGRGGTPSSPAASQQAVDERPTIDQIKAAENFHHRR
jgi:hypothetical protein